MKISENWLRTWVNPAVDSNTLSDQLTMLGLEVDDLSPAAKPFTGVVVGEVLTVEQHPDADRLRVTTVNIGSGEPLQIVCGAPNVRVGMKALWQPLVLCFQAISKSRKANFVALNHKVCCVVHLKLI
jgi:phenylalanyl-tRNA synthetase beta chain